MAAHPVYHFDTGIYLSTEICPKPSEFAGNWWKLLYKLHQSVHHFQTYIHTWILDRQKVIPHPTLANPKHLPSAAEKPDANPVPERRKNLGLRCQVNFS